MKKVWNVLPYPAGFFERLTNNKATLTKVIYIMSHFLIIPVNVILYFTVFHDLGSNSGAGEIVLAEAVFFAVMN